MGNKAMHSCKKAYILSREPPKCNIGDRDKFVARLKRQISPSPRNKGQDIIFKVVI